MTLVIAVIGFVLANEDPDLPPPAAGAETIEDTRLEDLLGSSVVRSATGGAELLERAPSVVAVFTREDIRALGARNLMDLLRLTAGYAEIADLNQRNVATRGVFGATLQHVLILVDGHRINDTTNYAASPDWVSLEYAERVEIVRGPGSAVYGANAFTGLINIITRRGKDTGPYLRAEYGEYNSSKVAGQYGYSGKKLDLFVAGEVRRSDGYRYDAPAGEDLPVSIAEAGAPRASAGVMHINGYGPSYDVFAKLTSGRLTLRLNAMASDATLSRGQRGGLLDYRGEGSPDPTQPVLGNSELFRPYRKDTRRSAELAYRWEAADDVSVTLTGYADHFSEDVHSINLSRNLKPPEGWVIFWGGQNLRLGAKTDLDAHLNDWLSLRLGASYESTRAYGYYLDHNKKGTLPDANPDRVDLIYDGRAAAAGRDTFGGVFANATATPAQGLYLTVGARADRHESYPLQLSPRLGVVYEIPGTAMVVKALYGQAYQAPPHLYRSGNALVGYQGRPELQPQHIRTTELFVSSRFAEVLYGNANVFYNTVTDFIKADFAATPFAFQNRGDVTLVGVETEWKLDVWSERLSLVANAHYHWPIANRTSFNFVKDGSLISVPRLTAAGAIIGKPMAGLTASVSANYHGVVEFPIRSPAANLREAYAAAGATAPYDLEHEIGSALTLNVAASYDLGDFELGLSGHNILDSADYAGGSVQVPYRLEGRVVLASVGLRL